jgi:subtilisin family serine protease
MASAQPGSYVSNEVIVKFKSDVIQSQSAGSHSRIGASLVRKITGLSGAELVRIPSAMSVSEAVNQYMSDSSVEYAEPNYIRKIKSTIPNDQYFGQQWALYNTGTFAAGTAGADIKANLAWDITTGSSSIVIAVIDTGIDYNHQDLHDNIWRNTAETSCVDGIDNDGNGFIDDCNGWDFTTCQTFDQSGACVTAKARGNDPWDDYGHGTHVSGIIGAKGNNNGIGIAGVMWNVKLMALKALNSQGMGTTADIIAALNYAVANGAKIINESIGGYTYSQAEYDAINAANTAGVLVVAAAGNESNNNDFTPSYPASYNLPNIISVAATDQNDRLASFSNFGVTSVHVTAPGVYILSTLPDNGYLNKDFWPGTSMATPHVSGTAGLLMTYYQHFNIYQIKATVEAYSDALSSFAGLIKNGRLNAYRAVSSLLVPTGLSGSSSHIDSLVLTWTDNATGETGYKIERKAPGETVFTEIASIAANSTQYTNGGLAAGTTYTYRVRAFNGIGNSLYSNETAVTTLVTEPTGSGGCSITHSNAAVKGIDAAFAALFVFAAVVLVLRKRK